MSNNIFYFDEEGNEYKDCDPCGVDMSGKRHIVATGKNKAPQPVPAPKVEEESPHTDIPAEEMRKIYKTVSVWNEEIQPWVLKGMVNGWLLAKGKLPRIRYDELQYCQLHEQHHWDSCPRCAPTTPETDQQEKLIQVISRAYHYGQMGYKIADVYKEFLSEMTEPTRPPGESEGGEGNPKWHAIPTDIPGESIYVKDNVSSQKPEGGEVPMNIAELFKELAEGVYPELGMNKNGDNKSRKHQRAFIDGAMAAYHRDQSTITALQQERDAYKDKWERAQKDIAALTEQIKAQ